MIWFFGMQFAISILNIIASCVTVSSSYVWRYGERVLD